MGKNLGSSYSRLGLSTLVLSVLICPRPSFSATLTFTTSRADIQANDQLDWSSLGPITPPQPFRVLPFAETAVSSGGLQVSYDIPPTGDPTITPPLIFQTTSTGIETNFAEGDFVLFTGLNPGEFPSPGNPGPLNLRFETPVQAVGTQIAVDDTFMFDAFISAFDQDDNLLGDFSAAGTSSLDLDNSALFLGAISDSANIARIEYRSSIPNRAIGINALSLRTVPLLDSVTSAVFVWVGLGLCVTRWLRKLKSAR